MKKDDSTFVITFQDGSQLKLEEVPFHVAESLIDLRVPIYYRANNKSEWERIP